MRNLALSVAAVLVLAVVSPALAQPFADVPTDHWAFDAIAELAAKGIIEGFPDGTFKGDRGVTRYELAMVVARILARIEAIKIPPPPPPPPPPPAPPRPEVTRADIQAIQRLVNEFRAELAALGVRVTAVEEELAALKGALDKTTITGDWTYVNTFGSAEMGAVAQNRARLTFKGSVGGGTALFVRARWNAESPATNTTDFDRVFFDWSSPWGIAFRLGRDYWSFANGILLSSAETSGARNGLRASGSLAGFSWTALGYNRTGTNAVTYGARVSTTLAGWSFGVNYRNDRDYAGDAVTLVTGWSADFSGDLFPGFSLSGEYASVSSPAAATAWTATLGIDLASLGMAQWSPKANVWYKDYPAAYPIQDAAIYSLGGFWRGSEMRRVTAFGADLSLKVSDKLTVKAAYESGTKNAAPPPPPALPPGTPTTGNYTVWLVGAEYSLAANTTLGLEYISSTGAATDTGYAAYLTYRW
jgi:hypothetical protein